MKKPIRINKSWKSNDIEVIGLVFFSPKEITCHYSSLFYFSGFVNQCQWGNLVGGPLGLGEGFHVCIFGPEQKCINPYKNTRKLIFKDTKNSS